MSALVEHGRYLLDRHGKPADPCLAVVDYLTSTRELVGIRRLVEDDIAAHPHSGARAVIRVVGRGRAADQQGAASRFQVTDEEVASSAGALLGAIMESGQYPRFRDVITNADRLDPKEEMQVSVELILDGAAARIAAAT